MVNYELNENELEQVAKRSRLTGYTTLHGWDHTLRVVKYAKIIAKKICPDKINDVLIAAYFHDSGRLSDEGGQKHAYDGAKICEACINKYWPLANKKSILFAIKHHADGESPSGSYPVVKNYDFGVVVEIAMCLWDADRLDLARMHEYRPIKIEYLNSKFAKEFANSKEHYALYDSK